MLSSYSQIFFLKTKSVFFPLFFGIEAKEQNYSTLIVHDSSITKPTEVEVNAKIQEIKDAEAKKIADKASANAKLKALGLTDDEIEAIK